MGEFGLKSREYQGVVSQNKELDFMNSIITTTLESKTNKVKISRDSPTVIIGERINPTGRKLLLEALKAGNFEQARKDAIHLLYTGPRIVPLLGATEGLSYAYLHCLEWRRRSKVKVSHFGQGAPQHCSGYL